MPHFVFLALKMLFCFHPTVSAKVRRLLSSENCLIQPKIGHQGMKALPEKGFSETAHESERQMNDAGLFDN